MSREIDRAKARIKGAMRLLSEAEKLLRVAGEGRPRKARAEPKATKRAASQTPKEGAATRERVLSALGRGPLAASAIARTKRLEVGAVTYALRRLRKSGVVEQRGEKRFAVYALAGSP